MFFYSDTKSGPAPQINIWKLNGTKQFLKHYDQMLFLKFVAQKGTQTERRQAEKEIPLCEKSMIFWRRHPNYVEEDALKGVTELKKNWTAPR